MPYTLNSSEIVQYVTKTRHSQACNPENNSVIVYEQTTLEQDKNPLILSSPMSQPTHKDHFKTLQSNNSYHSYHSPILTPKAIAFQQ